MRIQSLYVNRTNNNYNASRVKNNISNPKFEGKGYDYDVHWYGQACGPTCNLYENGEVVASGRSHMYAGCVEAVCSTLQTTHPGYYVDVKHVQNPNAQEGKVYLADPEETITEEMYKTYDFIATERRPDIPTVYDFNRKFHALSNATNYNERLDRLKDYYVRMLTADLKAKAGYEIKQLEDEKNLQIAIGQKHYQEEQLSRFPESEYALNELNKQKYFIYKNKEDLRIGREKIDYYNYKNEKTREKINFINNLENIINKTGRAFIDRDILADKYYEHYARMNNGITGYINTTKEIETKRAEKELAQKKLDILRKEVDRLSRYSKNPNTPERLYMHCSWAQEFNPNTNKSEMKALTDDIKEINKKLHELKLKRRRCQEYIVKNRAEVNKYKAQIDSIIKSLNPVYEELKAYYEANYPFNE